MTSSQIKPIHTPEDKTQKPNKLDNILHEIHSERIPKLAKHLLVDLTDYIAWANLANSYFKIGDQKMANSCWKYANYFKEQKKW